MKRFLLARFIFSAALDLNWPAAKMSRGSRCKKLPYLVEYFTFPSMMAPWKGISHDPFPFRKVSILIVLAATVQFQPVIVHKWIPYAKNFLPRSYVFYCIQNFWTYNRQISWCTTSGFRLTLEIQCTKQYRTFSGKMVPFFIDAEPDIFSAGISSTSKEFTWNSSSSTDDYGKKGFALCSIENMISAHQSLYYSKRQATT